MRRTGVFQTRFQSLEVWKSPLATELRVAGAIHASWHRDLLLTGLAWDLIAASAMLRPDGPPRSILMLGLAGGTAFRILRHLLPDCRFTAIDIDGEIISIAREHMFLDESRIEIHTTDAYDWLADNHRTFDLVFDDVYLAGKTDVFRPRAWCPEVMARLKRAVAPGGLLAVNLVTGAGHRRMQTHTRNALRGAWPVVRSLTTPDSMNEVLVAGGSVATRRRILERTDDFPQNRDRTLWRRIQVRKLS